MLFKFKKINGCELIMPPEKMETDPQKLFNPKMAEIMPPQNW